MSLWLWSTTPASNAGSDPTADLAANQPGVDTRNSVRAVMARVAADKRLIGGAVSYGGTGNAYTVTSASGHAIAAYATGLEVCLVPNANNTGAATVNVDGLGAKSIVRTNGAAVVSGDLVSGGRYILLYDGTNFQLVNHVPSATGGPFQGLDATLTAFAGLSFSTTNKFNYATDADAFAVTDAPGMRTQLGLGSLATASAINNANWSGTALAIANGGTGATSAGAAATALGLGTGDSPQFAAVNIGNATDTTLTRSSAGNIAVEGSVVWHAGNDGAGSGLDADTLDGLQASEFATSRRPASSETSGVLTAASANKRVQMTGSCTLNNSVFTAGDNIDFISMSSAREILPGAGVTFWLAGRTESSIYVIRDGIGRANFVAPNVVVFEGAFASAVLNVDWPNMSGNRLSNITSQLRQPRWTYGPPREVTFTGVPPNWQYSQDGGATWQTYTAAFLLFPIDPLMVRASAPGVTGTFNVSFNDVTRGTVIHAFTVTST